MSPEQESAVDAVKSLRTLVRQKHINKLDRFDVDRVLLLEVIESLQAELASAKADQARYLAWLGDPSIALEEREWVFLQSEEIQAKLDAAIASQQEKT